MSFAQRRRSDPRATLERCCLRPATEQPRNGRCHGRSTAGFSRRQQPRCGPLHQSIPDNRTGCGSHRPASDSSLAPDQSRCKQGADSATVIPAPGATAPPADSRRFLPPPLDASSSMAHLQASPGNAPAPSRSCSPRPRPCSDGRPWTSEVLDSSNSMTASCDSRPSSQRLAFGFLQVPPTISTLAVRLSAPLGGPAEGPTSER